MCMDQQQQHSYSLSDQLHDLEGQRKLMRNYLHDHFNFTEAALSRAMTAFEEIQRKNNNQATTTTGSGINLLHRKTSSPLSSPPSSSTQWRLVSLKFSNMFCYGGGNNIDFEGMQGVVGILGQNHIGKSAVLDVILFALFDRHSRGDRVEIMNRTAKSAKIDAEFYREDRNGVITCLSGVDRFETNRNIVSLVGNYEDFVGTNIVLQSSAASFFLNLTPATSLHSMNLPQQHEVLTKSIEQAATSIQITQRALHTCRHQIESGLKQLIPLGDVTPHLVLLGGEEIGDEKDFVERFRRQKAVLDARLAQIEVVSKNCQSSAESIRKELSQISVEEEEIAAIEYRHKTVFLANQTAVLRILNDKLRQLYGNLTREVTSSSSAVPTVAQKIKNEKEILNRLIVEKNKEVLPAILKINSTLDQMQDEADNLHGIMMSFARRAPVSVRERWLLANLSALSERIEIEKEKLRLLDTHTFNKDCPYCTNNSFVLDAQMAQMRLNSAESKAKSLRQTLRTLNDTDQNTEKKVERYWALKSSINVHRDRMHALNMKLLKLQKDIHSSQNLHSQLEHALVLEQNAEKDRRENEIVKQRIKDVEEEIDKARTSVNSEFENLHIRLSKMRSLSSRLNEEESTIAQANEEKLQIISDQKQLHHEMDNLKEHLKAVQFNTEIEKNLSCLRANLSVLERSLAHDSEKKNKAEVEIALTLSKEEELSSVKKQMDDLELLVDSYSTIVEATSKKGIVSMLAEQ
eukprot:jgi/Bigna1/86692/estExt_fgenesh1_pg.C_120271